MLRDSSSSFSPVIANSTDEGGDDDGEKFEDLPTLEQVLAQRKTSQADVAVAAEPSNSVHEVEAESGDYAEADVDAIDAAEGDEGANEDEVGSDNASEGDEGEDFQELGEAGQSIEADVDDRYGSEEAEDVDNHNSNDIEVTTISAQESPATKRSIKGRGIKGNFWDDPQDTERLLELLEQFAMREHYVNIKKGGWRNNAFGEIGKHMGKDTKYCSNKYMRLKHKYLEIVKLLSLGVGLKWDAENHKVSGHHTAWSKVKDPKLKKIKDRTFLYKEEFDNLNSVLKFAPSRAVEKPWEAISVVTESSKTKETDAESSSTAVQSHGDDEEHHDADKISDAGDEASRVSEAEPSSVARSNAAVRIRSVANRRYSDRNWFDAASMRELVRLLVEYVEEDYYINPVTKNWQNGVFREVSEKIGKTQSLCSSKYLTLKDKYADMERLLKMNMGFRLNDEKNEVVGSNGAWAQVRDSHLLRCRRSKFLFWEEFAKLAEKLNFVRRPYAPRKSRKRTRSSEIISRASRPSYVEASSDEVGESHNPRNENDAETGAGHESDEEPPQKKRFRSDTYEKRDEAFYLATSDMSAKREELKAIVDAQLAIRREQVAIRRAQITALHRQLKTETQLSRSLQRCHIKDKQRQDGLEDWRVLAQEKLQHEGFLTPRGKLRMMQTLRSLTSRTDGYLGVMLLELMLRKLWCKMELEKEVDAQLSDYFIEDENNACYKEEVGATYQEVADEPTVVELESGDEGVISMRGSSESRDSNVEESNGGGPDTSGITADTNSHGKHRGDSDSLENGAEVDDGENEGPAHVLNEKTNGHELSKKVENQVKNGPNDQLEDIEINPYISIEDDQSGDAPEDSDQKAKNFQDDEGLNQAFREIESEYGLDLRPYTTGEGPISAEFLNEDAL